MAKPTYVGTYQANTTPSANWGSTSATATRSTNSFSVLGGDKLIVFAGSEDAVYTFTGITGGSLTWSQVQNTQSSGNFCHSTAWTAVVDTGKSMTVSITASGVAGTRNWGFLVQHWRDSDGFGASASSVAANSGPAQSITSTQANSALAFFDTDWDATDLTSRTWRTINSIVPTSGNGLEKLYFRNASFYSVVSAIWDDAGAIGTYTTGLSSPATLENAMIAIEVKGTTSGVSVTVGVTCTGMTLSVGAASVPTTIAFPDGQEMVLSVGVAIAAGNQVAIITAGGPAEMVMSLGTAVAPHDAASVSMTGMTMSVGAVAIPGGALTPPTFRAGANTAYTALVYSTTIPKPTGTVENDIMLAYLFRGRGTADWSLLTVPTGWTQIGTDVDVFDGGFWARSAIWWKRAGASEPADYTWDHIGTTSSTQGYIGSYSGCPTSGDPVDVFSVSFDTSPDFSTIAVFTGVTTTQANDMLVMLGHNWEGNGSLTPPIGMTERFDGLAYSADQVIAATGATGTRQMTLASANPWVMFLVAIKGIGSTPGTSVTVDVTCDAMTASVGDVTIFIPGGVTVSSPAMTASVGQVTTTGITNVSTVVGGQEMVLSLGAVGVQTGGGAASSPTFRAIANTPYLVAQSSVTCNKPTGTVENDMMVAWIFRGRTDAVFEMLPAVAPTDFTKIDETLINQGTFWGYFEFYWKRAGSSEPSSYTWDHATHVASNQVGIASYSGVITSGSPIDVYSKNSSATGTTATGTGVTTTVAATELLYLSHNWDGNGALSPPSGMTERFDSLTYLSEEARASSGATGNRTQTLASNNPWAAVLIALKPGAGGGAISITVGVSSPGDMVASVGQVVTSNEQAIVTAPSAMVASVGQVTATSIGTIPIVFVPGMAASVGTVTVVSGAIYAWSESSMSGSGALSLSNQRFTVVAPATASIASLKKYGTGLHYAEVTITGAVPNGFVGVYDVATNTGVMIDVDTGQVVQQPSGTTASVFSPLVDGDTVGIAYDGAAGKVWFRVNGGLWNNNASHTPESTSVGLSAPPSGAGTLPGVTRTTYSGGMTVGANTLIENKNINVTPGDALNCNGANIRIINCRILCNDYYAINGDFPATTGLIVDHCYIDGAGIGGNSCVLTGDNWTITNCDLRGFENGVMVQGGTGLFEGNYVHLLDNIASGSPHVDGVQIMGPANGVIIRGNWIESYDTSCIFCKGTGGAVQNVTIEGNTLINDPVRGPTAYTVNSESFNFPVSGTIIRNNRMQPGFSGAYYNTSGGGATPSGSGNINYDTGNPVNIP